MQASFDWVFENYDLSILYYVGKANVVGGALSQKTVSMSCLTFLSMVSTVERHLDLEFKSWTNPTVQLDAIYSRRFVAYVGVQSSLYDQISSK